MPRLTPTRLLLLALLSAPTLAQTPDPTQAESAYLAGARLLQARQLPAAQAAFERATALNPTRRDYLVALTLTRDHRVSDLVQQSAAERIANHPAAADSLLAAARLIDPANDLLTQRTPLPPTAPRAVITPPPELSFAGPIQLAPSTAKPELHLRGDARSVVQQAVALYGIKPVFDESATGPALRFDLDPSPYAQSIPLLLRMVHFFAVPVDAHTLLIARDTTENRARLERQLEETLYIPGATSEQLNELVNVIKNIYDVQKISISLTSGTLLIRAPAPTLTALNYTLADLLDGNAEVVLDIRLISIDKNHQRNTGVNPPNSVSAFSIAAEAQNLVNANQALVSAGIAQGLIPIKATNSYAQNLLLEAAFLVFSGAVTDARFANLVAIFGHGLTLFGVNLGAGATANIGLNSSDSRALDALSVRVGDRQTTTLRVGSRYPITTSAFASNLPSNLASLLAGKTINGQSASKLLSQYLGTGGTAAVPPIFTYEDLGITLKTTPTVLKSGLVTVHVDFKIESLTGSALNNIPILASRAFVSDITVPEGTTAVMLSDMSSTEAASLSGIPGLSELPGFQQTAGDTLKEVDSSELVLLITPHLLRRRSNSIASRRVPFTPTLPNDN